MRCLLLAALVLAALLLAAGCTTTPPANATATPTPAPNTTAPAAPGVYTIHDSGRTVPLGVGQNLSVRLPENPSTGYAWNLSVSSGLTVLDTAYTPEPAGVNLTGAGGSRTWTVQGVTAGAQRIDAVYVRPWEPNLVANQFNLTVQVG